MANPTLSVRALDPAGDPIQGNGQGAFLVDLEAVAQKIRTTILLFQREWFENLAIGTPVFQQPSGTPSILGGSGTAKNGVIAAILQQRILSVPYVTGITNLQTANNPNTRAFIFSCQVNTAFGTVTISSRPSTAAINQ